MSQPSHSPQPTPISRQSQPSPRPFSVRRFYWLLPLLLIGSCVLAQLPYEPARWKLARALEARNSGQKERAEGLLADIFQTFPNDPMLLMQRAEWRLEDKQVEKAIEDADLALQNAGENRNWLMIHSSFLQSAGRHAAAVEDWKKINEISQRTGKPSRESALNGLAYAQALAQTDLDQALANVEQALEFGPNNPMTLDTRGFILYRKQQFESSLADFNRSITAIEEAIPRRQRTVAVSPNSTRLSTSTPKSVWEVSQSVSNAEELSRLYRAVAVVHYHRALVFRALGREKEAESDIARARELIGREPDETLF